MGQDAAHAATRCAGDVQVNKIVVLDGERARFPPPGDLLAARGQRRDALKLSFGFDVGGRDLLRERAMTGGS